MSDRHKTLKYTHCFKKPKGESANVHAESSALNKAALAVSCFDIACSPFLDPYGKHHEPVALNETLCRTLVRCILMLIDYFYRSMRTMSKIVVKGQNLFIRTYGERVFSHAFGSIEPSFRPVNI